MIKVFKDRQSAYVWLCHEYDRTSKVLHPRWMRITTNGNYVVLTGESANRQSLPSTWVDEDDYEG